MDGINWNVILEFFGLLIVDLGAISWGSTYRIPEFFIMFICNFIGLTIIKLGFFNEIEGRYKY